MSIAVARNDVRPAARDDDSAFYSGVPVFRDFRSLMDTRTLYAPLPNDWIVGVADVVRSTAAIADNRYKAVNMAGAAVIAAVTNALNGRDFPYVFSGDGAGFAISPHDRKEAEAVLAATATWAAAELNLELRVAAVPLIAIRAQGLDVRVARYAVSSNVSYAMFSGGGLAWAEAAMKRGEFAIEPAPSGSWPNLAGLSCRFQEIKSARGLILSILVFPRADADPGAFRTLTEDIIAIVEKSPDADRG
jgi:hypothetical protein